MAETRAVLVDMVDRYLIRPSVTPYFGVRDTRSLRNGKQLNTYHNEAYYMLQQKHA